MSRPLSPYNPENLAWWSAITGACIFFFWYLFPWPKRKPVVREPTCGSCGYIVRGLPSSICPECGNDLREVGILQPDTPKPPGVIIPILIWTCILPFFVANLTNPIISVIPIPHSYEAYEAIDLWNPSSNSHQSVQLVARGRVFGRVRHPVPQRLPMQELRISATGFRGYAYAEIDLQRLEFRPLNKAQNASSVPITVTEETLLEWLERNGFDTEDDQIRTLADDLMNAIHAAQTRSMTNVSFKNFGKSDLRRGPYFYYTPFEWEVAAGCIWMFIWLFGIWYLLRRRKRIFQKLKSFPLAD